ncbi:hypothetical protein J7K74_02675 [Candidatus Woesearchaeota archaeon]|nr:hypothetical protein [Candidatus Woesearchaeota archaeon]
MIVYPLLDMSQHVERGVIEAIIYQMGETNPKAWKEFFALIKEYSIEDYTDACSNLLEGAQPKSELEIKLKEYYEKHLKRELEKREITEGFKHFINVASVYNIEYHSD